MHRVLAGRLLLTMVVVLSSISFAGPAEAADLACGMRSPAVFADNATRNGLKFQKTVAQGDTAVWNTENNRALTPTTVRIRFVGTHFSLSGQGKDFTIAGQGNLQTGTFGGSLVQRTIVRETDPTGRIKSRTVRTVRNLYAMTGLSQWVTCPGEKKKASRPPSPPSGPPFGK